MTQINTLLRIAVLGIFNLYSLVLVLDLKFQVVLFKYYI